MIHYGDVTKIKGSEVPLVDIVTFGAPCQDLSVAGRRAGMKSVAMGDDETTRSGLFFEAIRIIKEMRNECIRQLQMRGADVDIRSIRPRYAVYENVPGAFSSNGGEDFKAVLEETAKVADEDAVIPEFEGRWSPCGCIVGDGWSIAWRVHDAQYWGVPQRRKRICLLADFNGDSAGKILFELRREAELGDSEQTVADTGASSRSEVQSVAEGLSGDTAESREAGQGTAGDVEGGFGATGGAISFQERAGKPGGGKGILIQNERTGALSTLNNQSVVYGISAYDSNAMKSANPNSGIYEAETSRTLDLNGGSPACNQGGMAVVCLEGNGARESHRGNGFVEGEVMYTLNTVEQHAVAYRGDAITNPINASNPKPGDPCHTLIDDGRNYVVLENHPADSRVKVSEDGVVQTLSGRMGTGGGNVPMVFSEVAAARCAQDGRGAVHTQMMSDPESNFVLEPYTSSKASYHQHFTNDGKAETLVASDYKDPPTVTYGLDRASFNQGQNAQFDFSVEEEKVGSLTARGPGGVLPCASVDCLNGRGTGVNGTLAANARKSLNSGNVVRCESVVRRLTPLECTRLQGFPDGWVDIGEWVDSNGKVRKDSDAPKYKALGNSIALPFWRWLAERIRRYYADYIPTMASLFDGIGGFPLSFSRAGFEPVWASEIEDFPIAVTKIRFPDAE